MGEVYRPYAGVGMTERERIERVDARTDNLQVIIDAVQHEAVKRERARVRRIIEKQTRWRQFQNAMVTEPYGVWIDRDKLIAALRGKGTR